MLRVAKYTLVAIPLFALLSTAACGSKKPPVEPSTDVDASASSDTPASSTASGDGGSDTPPAATPDTTPPPAAAATLALPSGSAKVALKGKKPGAIEIKSDGSVTNGGKAVGKISGMALQNADGSKSLLTVGSDGAVTTDGGGAYGSFSGDDLTLAKGDKVSVGDDGTVTMTSGGKASTLGKFDGVGTAKRAAVLAVAYVAAPPAADKPAGKPAGKGGKGGKKP